MYILVGGGFRVKHKKSNDNLECFLSGKPLVSLPSFTLYSTNDVNSGRKTNNETDSKDTGKANWKYGYKGRFLGAQFYGAANMLKAKNIA